MLNHREKPSENTNSSIKTELSGSGEPSNVHSSEIKFFDDGPEVAPTPNRTKKKLFGALLAFVLLIGAGGYFVYFHSALPLHAVTSQLENSGIRLEGISGSANGGFQVAQLFYQGEGFNLNLEQVSFEYSPGLSQTIEQIHLGHLHAAKASLEFKQWPSAGGIVQFSFPFSIGELSVESGQILFPDGTSHAVNSAQLSGFDLRNGEVNFGKLYIDGQDFVASFENLSVNQQHLHFAGHSVLQIRPELFPNLLKAPVDLDFHGTVESFAPFKPGKFELSAFGRRMNAKWENSKGNISISGLTPIHYFKTDLPLWNVEFQVFGLTSAFNYDRMQGHVGLRSVKFSFDDGSWVHRRGVKFYRLAPRLSAVLEKMIAGQDPGMILSSSTKQKAHDILAELYFTKSDAGLSEQERTMVIGDEKHFADSTDAGTYLERQALVIARPNDRKPAAVKKKSGVPDGVPTKLPPFIKRKNRK